MRICILQTAFTNPHATEEYSPVHDPGNFTDQHTFDHVWIHKHAAKEQIDEAVSKGYDFYFNFMPALVGQRSEVLERSKNDLYKDARALGYPRVPGTSNYPLFVKAASSCASQFITEKSLCRNREELVQSLAILQEALAAGRALAGRPSEAIRTTTVVDGIPIPEDVVVQEYVSGWDHSVVVIEVGDCPVALAPERYVYPTGFTPYADYLTFEVKFHPETHVELLRYQDDPTLYTKLQELAVQAFHANKMAGRTWCNVDIRVPPPGQGEPVVLEVNPMPAVFLPRDHEWEDVAIRESFPGGHRALINTMIASHLLRRRAHEEKLHRIAEVYDNVSSKYDENIAKVTRLPAIYRKIVARVDLSQGTILELGAGTGLFGRALAQEMQQGTTPPDSDSDSASSNNRTPSSSSSSSSSPRPYSITGIELSQGMAQKCRQTGVYEEVHHGAVQAILPTMGPFDHILSLSVLYFLPPVEFSLAMVRSFQLARKSLVVWIDEIPETYTAKLLEMGPPHSHMIGYNHLEDMEKTFCNPPPPGWKLAEKFRQSGWQSPVTGVEVYVTVYHFQREMSWIG
ncbi:hypothetical protein IFM58399_01439 [Aspergillus lentulus]|uniref:D-alanine--D-alanine ligase C-terminal domain-containing protein n=1 Tax=Aspergillus lentulus TaxID=293939 RepID=A0AAN5YVN2_ASPLE|nr:uncharacterized protein IFM58399_01439 [Aspergillus lentulus]KAF4156110.1 hypothetical protein CNMCM6069_007204 [Aspergillus lentulus]KAF4182402.1 hypothetical protein CNMCM8060_006806 [Aspergillus lentulus]KAF4184846.1 hypothetical protein CNMCM7927_007473 [Aspergillus lentulus]KAF4199101.1 hypothetical protein CNMCM8694_006854 [Aspergillus lentulus]KAF4208366.1 hypothetical protein CNMCM8927_000362 [Aspergillus lentulus]